ncbi:2Fe-2S iron-sulfur cluster-binding protein [Massilia sp. H-1]|nr:2Fe-2S iron-sulfur cluster-binding protein [Massilia sp. H-1]
MNAISRLGRKALAGEAVSFELNGKQVAAFAHETLIEVAKREGIAIPHLCYREGMEEVGNCRSCMVEIDGERVLAPSCCRHPSNGMKVATDSPRAGGAKDGARTAAVGHAGNRIHAPQRGRFLGPQAGARQTAFRCAQPATPGCVARGHHGQSGCLHPVHALRARLPRRAGQRCDRPGVPGRACEDRV